MFVVSTIINLIVCAVFPLLLPVELKISEVYRLMLKIDKILPFDI